MGLFNFSDIIFIKANKQPAAGAQLFAGVPDLIVEILSPSSYPYRSNYQI
jgi:Uma2 family endonuclease